MARESTIEVIAGRECLATVGGGIAPATVRAACERYPFHTAHILLAAIDQALEVNAGDKARVDLIHAIVAEVVGRNAP